MSEESTNAQVTTENPVTADTSSITDVLHYDPFAQAGDTEIPEAKAPAQAPAKKADDTTTEGSDETSATGNATQTQPSTKSGVPAAPAVQSEDSYRMIAEHLATIAGAKPQQEKPVDEPKGPAYDFNIPDGLVNVLTSAETTPDQFKQGLAAYAKGIAHAVHQQMEAQLNSLYNPKFEQLPMLMLRVIEQKTQAEAVQKDFYGTYPELDNEAFKPAIHQLGATVAQELGKSKWDTQLRDEVAKRFKAMLQVATGAAPTKAQARPAARMMSNQGARPAVQTGDAEMRDIADTLFSND